MTVTPAAYYDPPAAVETPFPSPPKISFVKEEIITEQKVPLPPAKNFKVQVQPPPQFTAPAGSFSVPSKTTQNQFPQNSHMAHFAFPPPPNQFLQNTFAVPAPHIALGKTVPLQAPVINFPTTVPIYSTDGNEPLVKSIEVEALPGYQTSPPPKQKRGRSKSSNVESNVECESPKKKVPRSNKVGKKHQTDKGIDDFMNAAINERNFPKSGVTLVPVGNGHVVVIDEAIFHGYVISLKPIDHDIKTSSLLEKLDKSRPCNRVDQKQKDPPFEIKWLRLDYQTNRLYSHLVRDIETIKNRYGGKIRVYTRRDWNVLPRHSFLYTPTKK